MTVETTYMAADADIDDIVQSLASMCLGMEAARIPAVEGFRAGEPAPLTASIAINGAWSGAVAVTCSPFLARRAASAMFGSDRTVSDEEACDALREIANIIGGNFKSLVSSPSRLSLPVLSERVPAASGSVSVHHLWFDCEGELLQVSVVSGDAGGDASGESVNK